LLLRVLYGLF
jgi:hypothetical protein